MTFHTYRLQHYFKESNGSFTDNPVELSDLLSIDVSLGLGTTSDTASIGFALTDDDTYDSIVNDNRITIEGSLDGSTYIKLLDGLVVDKRLSGGTGSTILTISLSNRLEKLFNAVVSTTGEAVLKTADQWVKDIINQVNEFNSLGGTNRNITYDSSSIPPISSEFKVSFIKDLSKAFDLIEELSRPEYTDGRVYIYYLDENNKFHFKPRETVVDFTKNTTNIDVEGDIVDYNIQHGVFNLINYIIMNAGKSPYDASILQVGYDIESIQKHGWKVKLVSEEEIASSLRTKDINSKPFAWNDGEKFPSSYPYVTAWGETVNSDAEYVNSFVDTSLEFATKAITRLLNKEGGLKFKSNMRLATDLTFALGDLTKLKIPQVGWSPDYVLRLNKINYRFNTDGWVTTVEFDEDEI